MKERYGFKIVTEDMKSLGLRRNPNIMTFVPGKWIREPRKTIKEGKSDDGGIWVAKTRGRARGYQKYMKNTYNKKARVFKARLSRILFENEGRIKTTAVFLEEEVTDK